MDTSLVFKRLHHARAAVLVEYQSPNSSKFALSAEVMNQEAFATALQLLQNNAILVLCIRAIVPVSKLWSAEAMLLNPHALDAYCDQQTAVANWFMRCFLDTNQFVDKVLVVYASIVIP